LPARPARHGGGLGARHVGEETGEPKKRGSLASRPAIGDAPTLAIGANLKELRFGCVHPKKLMTFRGTREGEAVIHGDRFRDNVKQFRATLYPLHTLKN
jgi:hypothetical protein